MNNFESANFGSMPESGIPQVGEGGITSPITDFDKHANPNPQNKKVECKMCFYVPKDSNVNLIALMKGADDFVIKKEEHYFPHGISFDSVRKLIDEMRSKLNPNFLKKTKRSLRG